MNPVSNRPSALLRMASRVARALLWLLLTAGCLYALGWGTLHWVIVPRIGNWKADLEQAATRALGIPVRIGALQADSTGPSPTLTLADLRLFDLQGREALHLPHVQGSLSLRSLLSLGFERIVIDGPRLEMRRRADGVITVAGIPLSHGSAPSDAADWFFSQREFLLRDGVLRWTDELRPQAVPLELRQVTLRIGNPGRQHQVSLDATPPAAWGQRFHLHGLFRQPLLSLDGAGQLQNWSGQFSGDFDDLRLERLREYLDPDSLQAIDLQNGEGALRFQAELKRGQWTGFNADVALHRLALRLGNDLQPMALRELSGRIELRHEGDALEFATKNLAFLTETGTRWPGGNLRYRATRATSGALRDLLLQGDRLDLQALRQLASHLPLPASGRSWLDRLQPSGLFEQLDLRWQAGPEPMGHWQAKGRISGLSLQAGNERDGRPGIEGANIEFDASEAGGRAGLRLDDGALEFPGIFEQPRLDFKRLQAVLRWNVDGERIEIALPQLSFINTDAEGQASGRWQTSDPRHDGKAGRFPGRLELDATLSRADGTRVHRYLPLSIGHVARNYVRDAVRRGYASSAHFKVRGELREFPFSKPDSGEFRVRASLHDVDLDYVPMRHHPDGTPVWPALSQIDAELHIDGNSLAILKGETQTEGLPQLRASQVEVRIPNLAHSPHLQVRGNIAGPASDALAFINRSPLLGFTGHALEQARITGQTQVQLQFDMPLEHLEATRIDGLVQFPGNDMQFTADTPLLADTRGSLRFSEQGFNVPQARTQLLGGELFFQGGMAPGKNSSVSFRGQGSASAAGLRTASQWPALDALGRIASGNAAYQVQLDFLGDTTRVAVHSSLQGLTLALPAPLGKAASDSLPVHFEIAPESTADGRRRDLLTVELGPNIQPVLSLRYEREHNGRQSRVLRGALALGTTRPTLPARGVQARLELGIVSLTEWQDVLDAMQSGNTPTPAATPDLGDERQYWPTSLSLRAARIEHEGRTFHDLDLDATLERNRWLATVEARQLKGRIEFQPADDGSPGRIHARLERLSLPHSAASEIEQLTQQAPVRLPALDVEVQDFELGARRLGRLEIRASNRMPEPAQREAGSVWLLEKLNLIAPEARLQASGNWAFAPTLRHTDSGPQRRTALQLKLDIDDAGALLARLGMPGVVQGGSGSLEGRLGWAGSPLALHPPSLSGELKLDLGRGQFLQADPGLAKLLGVLSLQALPRRLTLDFRDIFSQGFAFDSVRGDARVEQGVISSDNLQMKGINAAVFLSGSADLGHETQDLTALVIPELNAGGASLMASFVHPVVGLGSLIAQYLIGKPLQAAATQQFHISGSWYDPKVEKVQRNPVKLPEKN